MGEACGMYGKKMAVVDRHGYNRSLKNLRPRWDDNIKRKL